MTLVVGVRSTSAVALAADSRVTAVEQESPFVERDNATKLFRLGRYVVGTAGFRGMTDQIIHEAPAHGILDAAPDVRAAANLLSRHLHEQYRAQFSDCSPTTWPAASLMLAGCEADGQAGIYCLHSRAGFQVANFEPDVIGSARACTCVRLLRALLLPPLGLPTLEEAKAFGVAAVEMVRHPEIDLTIRGPIQMKVVTRAGVSDCSAEVAGLQGSVHRGIEAAREAFRAPHC